MAEVAFTQEFQEFLKTNKEALQNLLRLAELFATHNSAATELPDRPSSGPQPAVEGATYELTTKPLSQDDIDKLTEGAADAEVIERLHSFLSGFTKAITVMGAI